MSVNLSQLLPDYGDRAVFIGQTGCGKTTLAKYLISFFKHVVILDSKGTIKEKIKQWEGFKVHTKIDSLTASSGNKLVYTPSAKALRSDNNGEIETFFDWVYWRKNTLLYVDEAQGGGVTTATYIPLGYQDCIQRGREKGIMVFSATQRPSRLPQNILSEADNFYIFRLQLPADCKKVEETTGIGKEKILALPKQKFIVSRYGDNSQPLKLKL